MRLIRDTPQEGPADGRQAVEAYGIFSLGEIIGRRNLVGYKLKDN